MAKTSKSHQSSASNHSTLNPLVKKLFLSLKPSNITLGKRPRATSEPEFDYDHPDPVIDTPPPSQRRQLPPGPRRAGGPSHARSQAISASKHFPAQPQMLPASCVAIANEDHSENAVVITALNSLPFCCHADLLVMSRELLVDTAITLNAQLPCALQIDITQRRSSRDIRESIELLVGIQQSRGPPALRRIRVDHEAYAPKVQLPRLDLAAMETNPTQPSNSLSDRPRQASSLLSAYVSSPDRLTRLDEEEEEPIETLDSEEDSRLLITASDQLACDRPQKRKRLSLDQDRSLYDKLRPVTTPDLHVDNVEASSQAFRSRPQDQKPKPSLTQNKRLTKSGIPRSKTFSGPKSLSTRSSAGSRIEKRTVSNPTPGTLSAVRRPRTAFSADLPPPTQFFVPRTPVKENQQRGMKTLLLSTLPEFNACLDETVWD